MPYESAQCPACETYDNHMRTRDGNLHCAMCKTTWRGSNKVPVTSENGPARAALIVVLLVVLAVPPLLWLASEASVNTSMTQVGGVLRIVVPLLVLSPLVLAIIGLIIAIRRPTTKRESILALVMWLIFVVVVAWYVLATAVMLDLEALELEFSGWMFAQTGERTHVVCPAYARGAVGDVFNCAATSETGSGSTIQVTMEQNNLYWVIVK